MRIKAAVSGILSLTFLCSCGVNINSLTPDYLGEKKDAAVVQRYNPEEAVNTVKKDPDHAALLSEFTPADITAAMYDYDGIKIVLSIYEFENADEAFGFFSGLTSMPRLKIEADNNGRMAYREPFFAGVRGRFAFSFYSPTNPKTYSHFYEPEGGKILSRLKLKDTPENRLSYHYRFLPEENRFADSLFYVKQRDTGQIDVRNAYAAKYLAGRNRGFIFIEKHPSVDHAYDRHNERAEKLMNEGIPLSDFATIHPGRGFQWKDDRGINVFYTYKWFSIVMTGMPDTNFPQRFINIIFRNMASMRKEVLEAEGM